MLRVRIKMQAYPYLRPARYPTLPTMVQPSQPSSDQSTDRRVTVVEAAAMLSITPDAVRSRLRRGTLRKDRGPDGEVLVVLDGDASATDRPTDQPTVATVALVEALEEQITYLREQAALWQEEARRKDHLLAAALERIPALEEPTEARESHVTASEEPYSTHAPPEGYGTSPQEAEQSLHPRERTGSSWWRRFFGIE